MGGMNEPSPSVTHDVIDYVNIATTGNALDFGNLVGADMEGNSFASRTRGFFFGGDPAKANIETFVISSTGDATAFGNLTANSKTGIGVANSTRGIAALCTNPASTNVINYITMASTGSGVDFGDNTTNAVANGAGCQSQTRGIFAGGSGPSDTIGFITISTLGDTADFGDLTQGRFGLAGASNAVRGLFSGGANPGGVNTIDFITIATLGDALDFGDLNTAGVHYTAGCSSSTRVIRGGGADNAAPAGNYSNAIDYVQIMSTGNAVDFGDLIEQVEKLRNGLSNNTRGIFGGGGANAPVGNSNIINYVTISTLGDALDFGDLLRGKTDMTAASSPVRGLFFNTATAIANTEISYITIASTGNAQDFGDLTTARSQAAASSSS